MMEINPYKHVHLNDWKNEFQRRTCLYKNKNQWKDTKENQTQLFIETGHIVHAQTVIFATGYEAQKSEG